MPSAPTDNFRFQYLKIWQEAVRLGEKLVQLADQLPVQRHFGNSAQLCSAALSMSNNIA
jgi:four helix bundle protein